MPENGGATDNARQVEKPNGPAYEKLRRRSVSRFTLIGVLAIAAVGALVGVRVASTVQAVMIESYAESTAIQVSGSVNSMLSADDLKTPLRGEKYDNFFEQIERATKGTSVVKVKLWRTDGTVLFSDDREIVGRKFPATKKELRSALAGEPSFELSKLKSATHDRERDKFAQLLEFYYPVRADKRNPDKVTAVYEVYINVAPLEKYINAVRRDIAIGLTILVVLLIIIAEAASRLLRLQNNRLVELSAQLRQQADRDGLTTLHNHKHFQGYLEQELAAAKRYGRAVSLIMFDLDDFKKINDCFGHQVGDKVLVSIAGILSEVLRESDYAARYGGEEFVVVLGETDAAGAVKVAEGLRLAAERLVNEVAGGLEAPRVTISCGVATYPDCAETRESLITAADKALLFAKRAGRNRVQYCGDPSCAKNAV